MVGRSIRQSFGTCKPIEINWRWLNVHQSDKNIRLKLFKELLETNEVDVDEDGDNEPSAHLLAHQIDVLGRLAMELPFGFRWTRQRR